MISWAIFICGVILVGTWVYVGTQKEGSEYKDALDRFTTLIEQEAAKRSELAFRVTDLEKGLKKQAELLMEQSEINHNLMREINKLEAYAKRPQTLKLSLDDELKVRFAGRVGELPKKTQKRPSTSRAIKRKVKDITH